MACIGRGLAHKLLPVALPSGLLFLLWLRLRRCNRLGTRLGDVWLQLLNFRSFFIMFILLRCLFLYFYCLKGLLHGITIDHIINFSNFSLRSLDLLKDTAVASALLFKISLFGWLLLVADSFGLTMDTFRVFQEVPLEFVVALIFGNVDLDAFSGLLSWKQVDIWNLFQHWTQYYNLQQKSWLMDDDKIEKALKGEVEVRSNAVDIVVLSVAVQVASKGSDFDIPFSFPPEFVEVHEPLVDVEGIFQVAGVTLREVLFVTLHFVTVNGPNFILIGLVSKVAIELLFDELGCTFHKPLLNVCLGSLFHKGLLHLFHHGHLIQKLVADLPVLLLCLERTLVPVAPWNILQKIQHLLVYHQSVALAQLDPPFATRHSLVFTRLLAMMFFVYFDLTEGHIVQFGAGEFGMFFLAIAKRAGEYLELVWAGPVLVPKETKMQVVHVRLPENIHHVIIGERVDHRVFEGFGLIDRPLSCQELQPQNERAIVFLNLHLIDHHIVEVAVSPLCRVAYLALPQDQQVIVVIDTLEHLLRMTDRHFDLLREVIESLVYQA